MNNQLHHGPKAGPQETILGSGSVIAACGREGCEQQFRHAPSTPRIYCTPECFRVATKGKKRNYPQRMRTAERITLPCGACGKPVERRKTDSLGTHYCDRSCVAKVVGKSSSGRPGAEIGDTRMEGGYVAEFVGRGHPAAGPHGWLRQHRLVMSEVLGRPLLPNENVHHINGVRDDNRPENLQLWVSSQPKGQRASDLLDWADEIYAIYGKDKSILREH